MDCRAARRRLNDPDDEVRTHAAGCPACAVRLQADGRVEALLASTPAPPVPADLLARVLAAVAWRRAQDARWVRSRAPLLVAAAAAVVLALGPLGGWVGPSGWQAGLESSLDELHAGPVAGAGAAWSALAAWAADGAGALLAALPSPPLLLLLVLGPALLVANRSLARVAPEVA